MHIKPILSAAAIALVASLGTASAAEQFTTLDGSALLQSPATGEFAVLDGLPAEAIKLTAAQLDSVRAGAGNVAHGSPNVGPDVTPWSALFDNAMLIDARPTAGKSGVVVLVPRQP